jgi:hypothetical protein
LTESKKRRMREKTYADEAFAGPKDAKADLEFDEFEASAHGGEMVRIMGGDGGSREGAEEGGLVGGRSGVFPGEREDRMGGLVEGVSSDGGTSRRRRRRRGAEMSP